VSKSKERKTKHTKIKYKKKEIYIVTIIMITIIIIALTKVTLSVTNEKSKIYSFTQFKNSILIIRRSMVNMKHESKKQFSF
jgi:hypothetical protein